MSELSVHSTSGFLPWIEFAGIRIQTYFVVISLVLSLIAIWVSRRARDQRRSEKTALDLFIVALVSGFIGSRLLHIIWEEPAYYLDAPLRVFDVMSGGFVWYGGLLGGAIGFLTLLKIRREPLMPWLDFFSPVVALGYAGGRFACVLTGCCFGRVCDWPPFGKAEFFYRFPTQGFAVVWELALGLWLLRREASFPRGRVFYVWLLGHALGRVAMELLRADPRGPRSGLLSLSLAISLILFVAGLTKWIRSKPAVKTK